MLGENQQIALQNSSPIYSTLTYYKSTLNYRTATVMLGENQQISSTELFTSIHYPYSLSK